MVLPLLLDGKMSQVYQVHLGTLDYPPVLPLCIMAEVLVAVEGLEQPQEQERALWD